MADYLKLPEVARRLDVSEKTARRMVKSGSLPAVFIGGAYRISEEDLEEYLESAKVTPGKADAPSSQRSLFNGGEEERREPTPPEPPEEERIQGLRTWTVFFPGRAEGPDLKAAFWIECLNTQADLCERIIACGGYDLETMWDLEGATIELWGAYSKTLRELVHQWCTPGQADALQRAEDRMKAARTAARRAYQGRRDAEENRQKVDDLDARRRLREARYTDQGHANAGT